MAFKWLSHLHTRYILHRHPIPHELWHRLMRDNALFHGLTSVEKAHLRELTTLFLHQKNFKGTQGFEITLNIGVAISAQACLLILHLGLEYYDECDDIIIYPGAFKVARQTPDEMGLVSHEAKVLAGESWLQGPVIVSWDASFAEMEKTMPGHNVVLHEFAHKLDMLNGRANGMPPLHRNMVREVWTKVFTEAFEHLQTRLEHHQHPEINEYAATSPAEFFAVTTEYFFTAPTKLRRHFPKVFTQLCLFYRQNPIKWQSGSFS
ncbi:Protein MtfA [Hydrogenovibrio crunogenus]|uniref:Protein MtfA n=1 Tax=Hydrogenovibrio crunogenus TaxID=39765 RepID=A0A4P7P262_9GAMM|nr:M90 family metallopeptidase [Hydrogenovibrio crunogenus]QBZ84079.1 Protein MtfA [Hydrogenovibrio crunogenus]